MKKRRLSRREFLARSAAGGLIGAACASQPARVANSFVIFPTKRHRQSVLIDRAALIKRHDPVMRAIDPLAPLSLGNGEFAFTADVTGLQTFPHVYEAAMPLCTMSQWGWHTSPARG